VRRLAAIGPELAGIFAHNAIDRVGVHPPALVLPLAIVLERAEQGPVDIGATGRSAQ
jgi:hypothetical protein